MKRFITAFLICFLFSSIIYGQLGAPDVEAIYGGRVNYITGYSKNSDTTVLFISTESANSAFFCYISAASSASPVFNRFTVMPGLSASQNYGPNIKIIAAHKNSGNMFFIWENRLLRTHPSSSSVTAIDTNGVRELLIKDDYIFYIKQDFLYYGTLNSSGNFISGGSPITLTSMSDPKLLLNPINNKIYIFQKGAPPTLFKSSSNYNAFTSATSFSTVSLVPLSTAVTWQRCGIGPDGRLFFWGNGTPNQMAYTDDELTFTSFALTLTNVQGDVFAFGGTAASYYVYFCSIYSNNKGVSGSWMGIGNISYQTHPNDGINFIDPNNQNTLITTTDQGVGASIDRGLNLYEINSGVVAVQVNDFSMYSNKQVAYCASKSGIWRVSNYLSIPVWSNAIFPNGDGSPYHSVAMKPSDTNIVYAGNVRVYKSINRGTSWSQIFTAENPPYNFSHLYGIEALEVCPFNENIVMAGYFQDSTWKGGLFVSLDAGANWSQILIKSTVIGEDVDVFDIVFNMEGSDTVAYVGVQADLVTSARSIYKVTKSGSSWVVSQDMGTIWATIRDIEVSLTGDTIFACGTDVGINHPIAYYKPRNTTGIWSAFTTSGFPYVAGKQGYAITIGYDTVFCAVDNQLYYYKLGATAWSPGYTYPVGMKINFLYYDELMAGTSLGLYSFHGSSTGVNIISQEIPNSYFLEQNYPNPFNPVTRIKYGIPMESAVKIAIYDILGREVKTLINETQKPGIYEALFDASFLPSGTYFCRITAKDFIKTKRLVLVK